MYRNLFVIAAVAAGCGLNPNQDRHDLVDETGTQLVVSLSPDVVFTEGGTIVRVSLDPACPLARLSIRVGDTAIESIVERAVGEYEFAAPPLNVAEFTRVPMVVACANASGPGAVTAEGTLAYDPEAEPAPVIVSAAPTGEGVSASTALVVTFSRAIDPATVTDRSFGISGVPGTISASTDFKTFTLTPAATLNPATQYTAFVTTEIRAKVTGKHLRPTGAPVGGTPAADKDQWVFKTATDTRSE